MTLFELWFSQGICPVVGLLGHMVVLLLMCFQRRVAFSEILFYFILFFLFVTMSVHLLVTFLLRYSFCFFKFIFY